MNETFNNDNCLEQVDVGTIVPDEELEKYKVKDKELFSVKETTLKNKTAMANLLGGLIIGGFLFCVIIILCASVIFKCIPSSEASDLLKTISTIFGTSLGFVLGYFYGVNQNNN